MDNDPWTERLIRLGKQADRDMINWAINNCNCMVRHSDGPQMPAVRKRNRFFTPQGDEIVKPTSFEDMTPRAIVALMKEQGEIYIGHMFWPFLPS